MITSRGAWTLLFWGEARDRQRVRGSLKGYLEAYLWIDVSSEDGLKGALQSNPRALTLVDLERCSEALLTELRRQWPQHPIILLCRESAFEGALKWLDLGVSELVIHEAPHLYRLPHALLSALERADWNAEISPSPRTSLSDDSIRKYMIALASLTLEEDAHEVIAENLKEITGASASWFATYEPGHATFVLKHLNVAPSQMKWISGMLQKGLDGMEAQVTPELERYLIEEVVRRYDALDEVTFGALPRPFSRVLQSIFKVDRFIALSHVSDGRLFGGSVLAMRRGCPDPPKEWLESVASITSLALRRREAEEALVQSERRYRLLADNTVDCIWRMSLDAVFEYVNATSFTLLGYTPEEMIGTPLRKYCAPESYAEMMGEIVAALANPNFVSTLFTSTMTRRDGMTIDVEIAGRLLYDDRGVVIAVQGITRDISERLETLQRIKKSEGRLRAITDNISDMVSTADLSGRFTYLSPSHRQLGYAPEDLEGLSFTDLAHAEDQARIADQIAEALKTPTKSFHFGCRLRRADGSWAWMESVGQFIVDETQAPTEVIFSARDLSKQKEMEVQLAQADRLSSMGMLAAGVAHEINNPLSYILYNLKSLHHELPAILSQLEGVSTDVGAPPFSPEDLLSRLKQAWDGTLKIRDIVRGLGTFSRVETTKLTPVYLHQIIDAAANMAYNEVKYRARLVKDYEAIPKILGSEGRLSQVFLNLIINATHAIKEGDVSSNEIRLQTWSEGQQVFAQVKDTGAGIPKEHLSQIFEPFFTTKKKGEGSGLGLSISRRIVEDLQGSLSVESEVGKGTTFTLRWPAYREEVVDVVDESEEAPPATRGKVLVVDDEAQIRAIVSRILEPHETHEAKSGVEAIELLKRASFDAVVSDIMMKDLSGIELHRWLTAYQPALAARFIFITGGVFTPSAREYLNQVSLTVLEKPFDPSALSNLVQALVDQKRKGE